MSTKTSRAINSLAPRDIEALKSIYDYRCLSAEQIYNLHYSKSVNTKEDVSNTYCLKKISDFLKAGIVEKIEYAELVVYCLTTLGIDVVKHSYNLPANIYDSKRQVVKRGYYRAAELKINPKYVNHQMHTNQFLIDFKNLEPECVWKYYDEKHISQFSGIRPDGLLTMFDIDFFIEMDMGTESKAQLIDKWANYRYFLNSREFQYIERKIVVLFICEGVKDKKNRADLIKHTINDGILDKIGAYFEIIVGGKDEILNYLKTIYLDTLGANSEMKSSIIRSFREKHGFNIAYGDFIKKIINDSEYELYARKKDEENRFLITENDKVQEYLIDTYEFNPLSVMKKIAFLANNNVVLRSRFRRELSYIVVGESIEQLYDDLRIFDLLGVRNVYYTTSERLKDLPFYEALIQFDTTGNLYTFTNTGLSERVYFGNINSQNSSEFVDNM